MTLKRAPGKFGIGAELEKDFGSKAYWLRRGKALARKGFKGAILTDALRRPYDALSEISGIDAGDVVDAGKTLMEVADAAEDEYTKIRLGTDEQKKRLADDMGVMAATTVGHAGLDYARDKALDLVNNASARASERYQKYVAELRRKGISVENGDQVLQKYVNEEVNRVFDEYQKDLDQKGDKLSAFVSDVNSALRAKRDGSAADAMRVFVGLRAQRNGVMAGNPTPIDRIPYKYLRRASRFLSVLPFAQARTIVNPVLSGYASYTYGKGSVLQALKDAGKSFVYELPWGDKLVSRDQIVDGKHIAPRPIPDAQKPTAEQARKIVDDKVKDWTQKGNQILGKGNEAVKDKWQEGSSAMDGVKNKILGWPSPEAMRAAGVSEEAVKAHDEWKKWSREFDVEYLPMLAAMEAEESAHNAKESVSAGRGKAKDRANKIKKAVRERASKFDAETAKREASDRARKGMGRTMKWFGHGESDDE